MAKIISITDGVGNGAVSSPLATFQGGLINGRIVPSVASNNLTLAIKGLDGNDPSATNPVYVRVGNAIREITAALSVTKNAGTNWFNAGSAELAAKDIDYFVYLIWNTTPATDVIDIGFSRIPYGTVYSDFSGTTANEKYLANGNASAPTSTNDLVNIGRFRARLSAGAGYTWYIPSSLVINRPIFETDWLNYTPTFAGNASMAYSATASTAKYQIRHRTFHIRMTFSGTTSGSASNILKASYPFTPASFSFFGGALVGGAFGGVRLNGSANLEFLKYDLSNYGIGGIAGDTNGTYDI